MPRPFPHLSPAAWVEALLALPLVIAVRGVLLLFPFRRVRSMSGFFLRFAGPGPRLACEPRRIGAAVRRASRVVPGATCLTQALSVQLCLSLCGIRSGVHIGVGKSDDGRLHSHAWVEHEGRIVSGQLESPAYTPVISF